VESRGPQEIQCDFRLRLESVPQVQWKGGVYSGESCHKVLFESSDGAFSGIAAMAVRRHQLVLHITGGEKILQSGRCLVVESLEFWFKTLDSELLMDGIIGLDPF
jgi:hypothetical protein